MGNYKINKNAKADLIRIHQYGVREFGEAQGDKYYLAFFDRFEQLAEEPYSYQAVDYIKKGYRRSVCGADSIYYQIKDNEVEIMRILGRQDREVLSKTLKK